VIRTAPHHPNLNRYRQVRPCYQPETYFSISIESNFSIYLGALYDFDEALLLDPVAHSPLEDLVDMALRELHEEEALCGSVGSSFDLYSNQNRTHKSTNQAKIPPASKMNDPEFISDFLMDDELNLSDPTKSSWRREVVKKVISQLFFRIKLLL
jgi:hypothetical protein